MPQSPLPNVVNRYSYGPSANIWAPGALGAQGDQLVSQLHAGKYAQAITGNLFFGANQAGATLSNGLATTYVGLCLSNPAASDKNLVVRHVAGSFVAAPGAVGALGLITGFAAGGITAHTTPATVRSAVIGASAAAAQGLLDAACTLVGTPLWTRPLAVSKVTAELANFSEEIDGSIVLQPGAYMAIGSFGAAGPATGFLGSIEWEEVAPLT